MENGPNSVASRGGSAVRGMRCAAMWALGSGALCLVGCAKPPTFEFDELDVSRAHLLNEFPLGKYEIPVPIASDRTNDQSPRRNRLRFDFELHALVPPEQASIMAGNWARHEGTIRDRVIRVCRNASLAELQEPELATLKARLMDALQAQLGEREVRRLLMTEVITREL